MGRITGIKWYLDDFFLLRANTFRYFYQTYFVIHSIICLFTGIVEMFKRFVNRLALTFCDITRESNINTQSFVGRNST